MSLFVLILLLIPTLGFSQIVTSSYDRTTLSQNPASATTRHYSQVALFDTFKDSKSQINELRPDGVKSPWEEKIRLNKVGVYFTGHGMFAPELYLSRDTAERTLELDQVDAQKQNSKINLINNMVNLGLRLKRHFSIGLKFFNPKFDRKEDFSFNYAGGPTTTFKDTSTTSFRGIGGGFNYQYSEHWYLGGYYTAVTEKTEFNQTYTDSTGATTSQTDTQTFKRAIYGGGISFLEGTRGRGMRMELAYSRMKVPKETQEEDGEEIYGALELSHRRATFGANLKMRKNVFFDNVEIIDVVSGDKPASKSFSPSFGGFFSFGFSHGHTVGISGMIYKTTTKKDLFGQEQDAETAIKSLTFNYAYLF